jgi:putative transposase
MAIRQDRNLRWSLDLVMDTLVGDRRFRILTVVDDFTRECLGLVVDTSLTALRVMRELDHIIEVRGYMGSASKPERTLLINESKQGSRSS